MADRAGGDNDREELYRAAHDLNNLLGTIRNYAELISDAVTDAQVKKDADEIQRAATDAARIARQILDAVRAGGIT